MALIGQSAGKSFAYILGVYLGDGCITHQNAYGRRWRDVFRLNTIDEDFAATTRSALYDIGCKTVCVSSHPVKKSTKPNWSLHAALDEDVLDAMREMTDHKRKLPDGIMEWSKDDKLAFIAGVMDSEGYVKESKTTHTNRRFYMGYKSCDIWVSDFIRLLESVGIRIGKVLVETPRKAGYKTPVSFTIKMQSWIDSGAKFNIRRKQDRVDSWAECGPYSQTRRRRLASETARGTPGNGEMVQSDLL